MSSRTAILVRCCGPLSGVVPISGAKNSVLKLMAATLLAPGHYVIRNVPRITDVQHMSELLQAMAVSVEQSGNVLTIDVPDEIVPEAPYELVERTRASILVLGPLLARTGEARVALPGGDDFGPRPIDLRLLVREGGPNLIEMPEPALRARACEHGWRFACD